MTAFDRIGQALALQPFVDSPYRTEAPRLLRDLSAPVTTLQQRSWPGTDPMPPLDVQVAALRGNDGTQPWRSKSVAEALSYPAIFRSVALIANVTGMLSMKGYRGGQPMPDDQRPKVLVRPDPRVIPREFWRPSGWDMACYGEAWWWVAVRDPFDGQPITVVQVPAIQVQVSERPGDPLRPRIEWRGVEMPNEDMRQIVAFRASGALRGAGPLQMCGAAVSVAVEAQQWAANFYASGGSQTIIKSAIPLGEDPDDPDGLTEAERMALQWSSRAPNLPHVTDPSIEEVDQSGVSEGGATMLQSRGYSNGDAARMFGIPGALLEHSESGSSLTYQNVGQVFTELVRRCLLPDYLEPMEQTFSDLLPRQQTCRFWTADIERADLQTLATVVTTLTGAGLIDAAEGRGMLGLDGSIETMPVPPSPPSAAVPALQFRGGPDMANSATLAALLARVGVSGRVASDVRCVGRIQVQGRLRDCGRLLGRLTAPYEVVCPRCKTAAAA